MAEEKSHFFHCSSCQQYWGSLLRGEAPKAGRIYILLYLRAFPFVLWLTLALIVIMAKEARQLGLSWKTEGVRARLVMIGTLGFLLDWTAFLGLSMSSAATGTALLKCDVLMVNIISVIVYKQKFTWKAWVCTFVMLFGVFMVMGIDFTNFKIARTREISFSCSVHCLFPSMHS